MNERTRIELTDTPMSAIIKLVEGNPGAATVCVEILSKGSVIDPDSALGGLGGLLALDTHGIYGSRIWLLYKDVCGQDITLMIAVLRAVQLGQLSESRMLRAIEGREALDLEDILAKVRSQLPRFAASELPIAAVSDTKGGESR